MKKKSNLFRDVFITRYSDNNLEEFATVVNLCDTIICGDTMVLHLALTLNKKIIAQFFATSPWEVETYGIGKKLISPLLEKYFYTPGFIQELSDSISIEQVLDALEDNTK